MPSHPTSTVSELAIGIDNPPWYMAYKSMSYRSTNRRHVFSGLILLVILGAHCHQCVYETYLYFDIRKIRRKQVSLTGLGQWSVRHA